MRILRVGLAAGLAFGSVLALTGIADAQDTSSAKMKCGHDTYIVTGFGRGAPLKLSTSNSNYVVKYAVDQDGNVVVDAKGQEDKDLVECTVKSPVTGVSYTLQGYFTPQG
jgi:hypothetical protein